MDLTYAVPSMYVPGYKAPLADDVASVAKKYLGDFFENKDEERSKIMADARGVREVYDKVSGALKRVNEARKSVYFDIPK